MLYICDLCFTQGPRAPTPLPITLSWRGRQEQGRERKRNFLTESLEDRLDFDLKGRSGDGRGRMQTVREQIRVSARAGQ